MSENAVVIVRSTAYSKYIFIEISIDVLNLVLINDQALVPKFVLVKNFVNCIL